MKRGTDPYLKGRWPLAGLDIPVQTSISGQAFQPFPYIYLSLLLEKLVMNPQNSTSEYLD